MTDGDDRRSIIACYPSTPGAFPQLQSILICLTSDNTQPADRIICTISNAAQSSKIA